MSAASFADLLIPYSHPQPTDLSRAFQATGIPATLAAAGTVSTDAALLVNRTTLVTGSNGSNGVILPAADSVGHTRTVVNTSNAGSLRVYPDAGGTIDGAAVNVPVVIGPDQTLVFQEVAASTWVTLSPGGKQFAATSTSDGLTTGLIPSIGTDIFVTVTSADVNNIVTLPFPVPGTRVTLVNGATGYEIRSNSPTTVAINGGTGAAAESAIAASMVVYATCVSATRWIAYQQAAAGTLSAVEAAAP